MNDHLSCIDENFKERNVTYTLENVVFASASRKISLCYIQDETRLEKESHNEGEQNVAHAQRSSSSKMIRVNAFYSCSCFWF